MHITLATVGSRGDVQPYIALGVGLKSAGHSVCVATHRNFEHEIRDRGLDFSPVEGNPRETVESELGQKWLAAGRNTIAFTKQMVRLMDPMMVQGTSDCLQACRGADLVLYSILGWIGAHSVAEKLGIPGYAAFLQPVTPTRSFPSFAFPIHRNICGFYNRLTYSVGEQMFWLLFRRCMNQAREEVLDLPKLPLRSQAAMMRKTDQPVFNGYSSTVIPKPPDWPDHVHVTGYWFLDQQTGWEPPPELLDFLNSGPPPVYVGFGSMFARNAEWLTTTVVDALTRASLRGIVLTGWGGLTHENLPDHVFAVDSIPHDWLFPRVAAVVHHGGAGTTAAGLHAGAPTIVVPFFGDQYFWGSRVAAIGAGPTPIPVKRLSAERLEQALRDAVSNQQVEERVRRIGETIRAEDGVATVVEILEKL